MSGREKPLILQNGVPIPQEYDKDLGDWTEYSNEHIKAIKAELALVKAELQTIKQQQIDGSAKVALSGTKVVLQPVYAVAIADTEVRTYQVDVKGISDIMIVAYSTLDQPVTVAVDNNAGVPFKLWDTDTNTFKNAGSVTVPAHAGLVLVTSHPAAEFVKRYSGEGLTLRIKCNTAPAYGSLSIAVSGVRV